MLRRRVGEALLTAQSTPSDLLVKQCSTQSIAEQDRPSHRRMTQRDCIASNAGERLLGVTSHRENLHSRKCIEQCVEHGDAHGTLGAIWRAIAMKLLVHMGMPRIRIPEHRVLREAELVQRLPYRGRRRLAPRSLANRQSLPV